MKRIPVFPFRHFILFFLLDVFAGPVQAMPVTKGEKWPVLIRSHDNIPIHFKHFFSPERSAAVVLVIDTPKVPDTPRRPITQERDLFDVYKRLIRSTSPRKASRLPRIGDVYFSFLPTTRVTPSASAALLTATNAAFYLGDPEKTYLSFVNFSPVFTFEGRFTLPVRSTLWADNNRMNLLGDWRYTFYPENTYGLGAYAQDADLNRVNYRYIRVYQTVLRKVYKSLFFGPGYHLDYHYRIREEGGGDPGVPTAFQEYGYGTGSRSLSSGISFNLLRDTRSNSINPTDGSFSYFVYRVNMGMLGSDQNWQSIYLDFRRYFKLQRGSSRHILAVWSFVWSTVAGNPPYLDLPSIGWDSYNVTGRGYEVGRYRGRSMLYLETEYRFPILKSGLLGGVVFMNGHSVSEPVEDRFARVLPAAGLGLRLKLNRQSRTNIAMDFGWGVNGFGGIYFNIGETF